MKQFLLQHLPLTWINALSGIKHIMQGDYPVMQRRLYSLEKRVAMAARYQINQTALHTTFEVRNPLNAHELSVHSQNGEDGILLYLFTQIGTTNQKFVEFGIGNGSECNTANLSLNFGWTGLLMEANLHKATEAQIFYSQQLKNSAKNVTVLPAWVTPANINELIRSQNITGEIDLLSIDIDGNDYWVWQAVRVIQPRIVVIEYNATFGSEHAVTIPYTPNFDRYQSHPSGFYHGASLAALNKLGQKKGYNLVGCDSMGTNAFFVHQDTSWTQAPLSGKQAYFPSAVRSRYGSPAQQSQLIADLPLVEV